MEFSVTSKSSVPQEFSRRSSLLPVSPVPQEFTVNSVPTGVRRYQGTRCHGSSQLAVSTVQQD